MLFVLALLIEWMAADFSRGLDHLETFQFVYGDAVHWFAGIRGAETVLVSERPVGRQKYFDAVELFRVRC